MNHLHQLLSAEEVSIPVGYTQRDVDKISKAFFAASTKAMCFWLGEQEALLGYKVIPELLRLPYEVCWMEFESQGLINAAMLSQVGLTIGAFLFQKNENGWSLCGRVEVDCADIDEMWCDAADKEYASAVMSTVLAFVSALNCVNVNRRKVEPAAALQKARRKRGKQPLFSYWTLELAESSSKGEWRGGTHASPRVHLRRGHPRQYAPGKWTWVQPCAVGSPAAGMVHKDYSADRMMEPAKH